VRFVSTPAILERFVTLENEILQIESSFQANALSMSNATPDEGTVGRSILNMFYGYCCMSCLVLGAIIKFQQLYLLSQTTMIE